MTINTSKCIILFDGECGLCGMTAKFVHRFDKKNRFRMVVLSSEEASGIRNEYGLESLEADSIGLVKRGIPYVKSDAVIEIMRTLGGIWAGAIVLKLIPVFVRNFFYDIVAKNRYHWFGKTETCSIEK
ncbi:MAG: DUF393 domain-containing protein [candidate division Zixibacteria bacterium]|nr:DUF393 domain-containing protein [candidate division Zixibacteria bacterium]